MEEDAEAPGRDRSQGLGIALAATKLGPSVADSWRRGITGETVAIGRPSFPRVSIPKIVLWGRIKPYYRTADRRSTSRAADHLRISDAREEGLADLSCCLAVVAASLRHTHEGKERDCSGSPHLRSGILKESVPEGHFRAPEWGRKPVARGVSPWNMIE